jgi:hypothetical protein
VIGTYAAVLAVLAASLTIGQAAVALCGARRWSWLSPSVGLALLAAVCWGTVRLPGHGTVSALVVLAMTVAAALFLRGRVEGGTEALGAGLPVGLAALAAASLPFVVEGRFGILGTGFNPDMSQHLLAADRLANGLGSQLLRQGYPLGPHSIVVVLDRGLGIGLVQGFSGLTIAVAVLAPLTALAAFADQPPLRRTVGALLVGLPYVVASYFAQGAFKETMQALLVLAFVLSLRESGRAWRKLPLRFVPAAVIAIGSVYAYSFPGLIWLVGALVLWLVFERGIAVRPALLALAVFLVGALPELGRMIDFSGFETFAPHGAGLGNLFGQISPLEALGIWPSGDFRIAPGGGAVPALAFYVGAAFAAALLVFGLIRCLRRRETAIVAGLITAAGVYVATRVGGTPYTAAKAIEVTAPLAALVILLPLLGDRGRLDARRPRRTVPVQGRLSSRFRGTALPGLAAVIYVLAAGGCSLLAFANAPVGPASYSPALTELRPLVSSGSTLVLVPPKLLEEEHGGPYIAWELRGGRVCIEAEAGAARGQPGALPPGVSFVISEGSSGRPPLHGLRLRRLAGPYVLWERAGPVRGRSDCPLIAVRQARQGPSR